VPGPRNTDLHRERRRNQQRTLGTVLGTGWLHELVLRVDVVQSNAEQAERLEPGSEGQRKSAVVAVDTVGPELAACRSPVAAVEVQVEIEWVAQRGSLRTLGVAQAYKDLDTQQALDSVHHYQYSPELLVYTQSEPSRTGQVEEEEAEMN
jgi:hypothetical protein